MDSRLFPIDKVFDQFADNINKKNYTTNNNQATTDGWQAIWLATVRREVAQNEKRW